MNYLVYFIWADKYRPHSIKECILPATLKKEFKGFLESGSLPNLLLCGPPGTGKTTVGKALCDELGFSYITFNGSTEGNIDTLRNDIAGYATTYSLNGNRKCVILDEADGISTKMQEGLRGFIELTSKNCSYILTCNYKNKIIEPIRQSRLANIDFVYPQKKSAGASSLIGSYFLRASEILEKEGVDFEEKVLLEIVNKYYPDFRRTLNELQRHAQYGIHSDILSSIVGLNIDELINHLKHKDFTKVREWVGKNLNNDQVAIMHELYTKSCSFLDPKSLAQMILIIGKYSYQAVYAVDPEINLSACLVELMIDCF